MINWTLTCRDTAETFDAYVPSDVQLIWKEVKNMPDYNFGRNYLLYKWMEDVTWEYNGTFKFEPVADYEAYLVFKGIDYKYDISLNGDLVISSEGMFTPVRIKLPNIAADIEVKVVIYPIPKIPGAEEGRAQAAASCKPPVSYGWDWHPRLVPSGIYDDVYIDYVPNAHITEQNFDYMLSDNFDRCDFTAKIKTTNDTGILKARIKDADGNIVCETAKEINSCYTELAMSFENPELWWCHNHGEHYLYTYEVEYGSQTLKRNIGFRRVKLVMNADDWSAGEFPVTQAKVPITMELNGRCIFCKGTNFVPTEIFPSRMTYDVYKMNLDCAVEANMNILRMWGGGLVNKEAFFDLCDEMGLLVWQEFPLACNLYPDDDNYLNVLDREAESIIKRLKSHPCVTIWCGGNELFNSWSKMTNQSLPLRLLDKKCYEFDRNTPFLMTSPLYGMGHGCYLSMSTPERECITDFIERDKTAYTEFGSPSPAPFDYVKQYMPEEEWYNVDESTSWFDHHALRAWIDRDTWFRKFEIEAYYGVTESFEQLIENGLELQGESYKDMFEEARRKWPHTSMAVNWCFNEPWPCFANNSLIMYPAIKRPAFYQVQKALRDQMLSVKLYKLRWNHGDTVKIEIYLLNDLADKLSGGNYTVYLESDVAGKGKFGETNACSSTKLDGEFTFTIPADAPRKLKLSIKCDNSKLDSEYIIYVVD